VITCDIFFVTLTFDMEDCSSVFRLRYSDPTPLCERYQFPTQKSPYLSVRGVQVVLCPLHIQQTHEELKLLAVSRTQF